MLDVVAGLVPVVLQTVVIYVCLVAGLRALGRRETSELTMAELAVIMIIGSSVETALIAGDTSLLAGFTSATTLFLCNRALSMLQRRWAPLRKVLIGRPIPLVYNGKYMPRYIHHAGLTEDDVLHGIRQLGFEDISQVRFARLEIHGRISVLPEKNAEKNGENEKPEGEARLESSAEA